MGNTFRHCFAGGCDAVAGAVARESSNAFVTDWQSGCWTMTELCADYQISRKTGYKWLERYETGGPAGLHDRSRRPHHEPAGDRSRVGRGVAAMRRRHPRWGAKKLLAVARRQDPRRRVAESIDRVRSAQGAGLGRPRRRRDRRGRRPARRWRRSRTANEVWTTDFKGEFRTGDGVYCYPLTLRDGFSRFVLRCDALAGPTYAATRPRSSAPSPSMGCPSAFAVTTAARLPSTGLAPLVAALGLVDAPGHHAGADRASAIPSKTDRTSSFMRCSRPKPRGRPRRMRAAQQRRFDRLLCRIQRRAAARGLARRRAGELLSAVAAPAAAAAARRSNIPAISRSAASRTIGHVSWRGAPLFLSEALAGADIAFEEVDDGLWTIRFATVVLGRLRRPSSHGFTRLPR